MDLEGERAIINIKYIVCALHDFHLIISETNRLLVIG